MTQVTCLQYFIVLFCSGCFDNMNSINGCPMEDSIPEKKDEKQILYAWSNFHSKYRSLHIIRLPKSSYNCPF